MRIRPSDEDAAGGQGLQPAESGRRRDGRSNAQARDGHAQVRDLGLEKVEHVESAAVLKLVINFGCRAGKGFWLMPPLAAEESRGFTSADQWRHARE